MPSAGSTSPDGSSPTTCRGCSRAASTSSRRRPDEAGPRAARADNLRPALARKQLTTRVVTTLAALAAGLALAACGRSTADLANGKKLFVGKATCGSCHTLARAGTRGTVGPNLDDAFADARARGFNDSVIEGVVRNQIAYPRRGSAMPSKLVTGSNARDVAPHVAYAAARTGQDAGFLASVGPVNTANKSTSEKNGTLTIPAEATGALAFDFGKATATAGKVTFQMP